MKIRYWKHVAQALPRRPFLSSWEGSRLSPQGDDGRPRVDHELPRIRETENRPRHPPRDDGGEATPNAHEPPVHSVTR